jgi:hypothetical protein
MSALTKTQDFFEMDKLKSIKLETSPYDYFVIPQFIKNDFFEKIIADYPLIKDSGSQPLSTLKIQGAFEQLIDLLNGDDFRKAIEEKFNLQLEGKDTVFSVRGFCRKQDGKIHTDIKSKIITVLLYLNPEWEQTTGCLRLLRSQNLEDFALEIPPVRGCLLVFRRSDTSFHGHKSFEGPRKVLQMNWVSDGTVAKKNLFTQKLQNFVSAIFGSKY